MRARSSERLKAARDKGDSLSGSWKCLRISEGGELLTPLSSSVRTSRKSSNCAFFLS